MHCLLTACNAKASIRSAAAPEEFAALIGKEIAQWRELAKSVNIKLD